MGRVLISGLVIAFWLTAGVPGAECGNNGEGGSDRAALLEAAKAEIDETQAIRDAVAADPEHIKAIEINGAVLQVDTRDLQEGLSLAASIAHEIIISSPTAAEMVNEQMGNAVGSAIEDAGINSDVADLAGWALGKAAQAAGVSSSVSEDQLRDEMAAQVKSRLDAAAMSADDLDKAIERRWQVYDWIDENVGGSIKAADVAAPEDFSGRWTCDERGILIISQVGDVVAGDFAGFDDGGGAWGKSGLRGGSGVGRANGGQWCMATEWNDGTTSNLEVALSRDKQSFSGTWDWSRDGNLVAKGQWGCRRP